jgi:hypothetical protein
MALQSLSLNGVMPGVVSGAACAAVSFAAALVGAGKTAKAENISANISTGQAALCSKVLFGRRFFIFLSLFPTLFQTPAAPVFTRVQ